MQALIPIVDPNAVKVFLVFGPSVFPFDGKDNEPFIKITRIVSKDGVLFYDCELMDGGSIIGVRPNLVEIPFAKFVEDAGMNPIAAYSIYRSFNR
jgi:hypothetical protein